MRNLVIEALKNKGKLKPFCIPYFNGYTNTNPSIYNDNEQLIMNVRCVNYIMHNSLKYPCWGTGLILYLHKEDDVRLATENYIVKLDNNLNEISAKYVDMSKFNIPPSEFKFHGLEDARIIRWDNKLYLSGVRRDTKDNGEGRIELSEIEEQDDKYIEISRQRIDISDTYCEKNWMPIIDKSYTYARYINEIININDEVNSNNYSSYRGSSLIIKYKNYYIAIVHSVENTELRFGEKNGEYYHYFVLWDLDFNIIKISPRFKFFKNAHIEFCCGMCLFNDDFIISFSDTDNTAYLLQINSEWILNNMF